MEVGIESRRCWGVSVSDFDIDVLWLLVWLCYPPKSTYVAMAVLAYRKPIAVLVKMFPLAVVSPGSSY